MRSVWVNRGGPLTLIDGSDEQSGRVPGDSAPSPEKPLGFGCMKGYEPFV